MQAAKHPSTTPPPPPDRREATRLRIIKGAAEVFGQQGFAGTSVQAILDAAGVSRRTFYQCFSDKSAVLAAIYERSLNHLYACRREAMKHPGSGPERAAACFEPGRTQYSAYCSVRNAHSARGSCSHTCQPACQPPACTSAASRTASFFFRWSFRTTRAPTPPTPSKLC